MLTELKVDHGELDQLLRLAGEPQPALQLLYRLSAVGHISYDVTLALMQCADADGDGFVSFEEFKELMHSPSAPRKPNMLNRVSAVPMPRARQPTIAEVRCSRHRSMQRRRSEAAHTL